MGARYSDTDDALANLRLFGVTPGEVWEALHSNRRVLRHLGDDVLVVYAMTSHGRSIAVLLAEADHGDNDWDVLSARELSDTEHKKYLEVTR